MNGARVRQLVDDYGLLSAAVGLIVVGVAVVVKVKDFKNMPAAIDSLRVQNARDHEMVRRVEENNGVYLKVLVCEEAALTAQGRVNCVLNNGVRPQ